MRRRKRAASKASAKPAAGQRIGADAYRASLSKRVWAGLAVLTGLLIFAGVGLIQARGELASAMTALRQTQAKAGETEVLLKSALADKQDIMKELAVQGTLIAQSSRDEEKARSELAALSSGAETADKRAVALAAEVADLKARVAQAAKAKAVAESALGKIRSEVTTLRAALAGTRVRLENSQAEVNRLRAKAEPYRPSAEQAGQAR